LKYCLISKIKVNWINVIKEHVFKIKNKPEYHIPCVVLIFNFIEYLEDVEEEVVKAVKAQNEIIVATLNKIGLKKVNDNHWFVKAIGGGADQQQFQEDDVGTSTVAADVSVGGGYDPTQFAYMSSNPLVEGEGSFTRFEQMVIN